VLFFGHYARDLETFETPVMYCSIGKTNEDRDLWVLKLGSLSATDVNHVVKMKMVAGLHGSDVAAQAILLQFAWSICHESQSDYTVQKVCISLVVE